MCDCQGSKGRRWSIDPLSILLSGVVIAEGVVVILTTEVGHAPLMIIGVGAILIGLFCFWLFLTGRVKP